MKIDLRDVIPADAPALARALITGNNAVFSGRVPQKCLAFTIEESTKNWFRFFRRGLPDNEFMIVADTHKGRCVGYAWGRPLNDITYQGELYQISVVPEFQGYGIGRKLVSEVARRLAIAGIHSMRVDVLQVNPNRRFYEHLGASLLGLYPFEWDGVSMIACVYGWADTAILTRACLT